MRASLHFKYILIVAYIWYEAGSQESKQGTVLFMTCFFRFCTILAFLKNGILQITHKEYWAVNPESLVLLPCQTQKLASHILFQSIRSYPYIQYFTVINR